MLHNTILLQPLRDATNVTTSILQVDDQADNDISNPMQSCYDQADNDISSPIHSSDTDDIFSLQSLDNPSQMESTDDESSKIFSSSPTQSGKLTMIPFSSVTSSPSSAMPGTHTQHIYIYISS